MKRDPAVMAFYMEAEVQAEFLRTRSLGQPNYNLLVKDAWCDWFIWIISLEWIKHTGSP